MSAVVGAVVVTHRSGDVLPGLLESLRVHEPDVAVVVVDSGTPGGPPEVPAGVASVALEENVGFGAACNAGVAALTAAGVTPDVVVCLNPDVRLTASTLTDLARQLGDRPGTGVAAPPVVDAAGAPAAAGWGPPSVLRAIAFGTGRDLRSLRSAVASWLPATGLNTSGATLVGDDVLVDGHVLGGAMAVTAACWEATGGFDEAFFLYWEDADLCHRARAAGFEVRVLPVPPVVHHAGTSSSGVMPAQRWAWYVDGARRFADRHLTPWGRRRLLAALRLGRLFSRRPG